MEQSKPNEKVPMHLQIVNFQLKGISREEYEALRAEVSPVFQTIPGLQSKYYLADEEGNLVNHDGQ